MVTHKGHRAATPILTRMPTVAKHYTRLRDMLTLPSALPSVLDGR